jgi:hypothetical protein
MIYVDEDLPNHPKIVRAGQLIGGAENGRLVALGCYLVALAYARHHVTDGVVPAPLLKVFPRLPGGIHTPATALVKTRLLETTAKGDFRLHDYHDWNPTAAEVKRERKEARERKAKWRADRKLARLAVTGTVTGLSQRDKNGHGGVPPAHDPRSTIHDPPSRESDVGDTPARALVAYYAERFKDVVGERPHLSDVDTDTMTGLLTEGHTEDTIRTSLDAMFEHGDAYVKRAGYPLLLFGRQFNSFLALAAQYRGEPDAPCPHTPPCVNAGACWMKSLGYASVGSEA